MMKNKHEKAEEFRSRIEFPVQRQAAICEMLKKNEFDASDELRLSVLFQKKQYLIGCETSYMMLINKLENRLFLQGKLREKVLGFKKHLNLSS